MTLEEENAQLRKWFTHLVDFIRKDQCTTPEMRGEGTPEEPCNCCSDYLEVANDAAVRAGLSGGVDR